MNTIEYSIGGSLSIAGLLFAFGLLYTFFGSGSFYRSPLVKVFMAAFAIRLMAVYGLFFYLLSVGADGIAITDDWKYHAAGKVIDQALQAGRDGYSLHSHEQNVGYFYFCGWLYNTFGVDTLVPRVVNAFFSAMTAVVMYKLAFELFGARCAKYAGLLFVLMPNLVFLSALQLKDSILIFLMAAITYCLLVKLADKIRFFALLQLAILFVLLWFFRKDFCLPLLAVLGLWMITRIFLKKEAVAGESVEARVKPFHYAVAGVLGIVSLAIILATPVGKTFSKRFEGIMEYRAEEAGESSTLGFTRYLRINNGADIVKLPAAMLVVLAMPLPTFSGLSDPGKAGISIYALANTAFVMLIPVSILGFVSMRRYQVGHEFLNSVMLKWTPLLMWIGISTVYMGVLRYKEQLMPFFLLWAAYTLSESSLTAKLPAWYLAYGVCGSLLVWLAVELR